MKKYLILFAGGSGGVLSTDLMNAQEAERALHWQCGVGTSRRDEFRVVELRDRALYDVSTGAEVQLARGLLTEEAYAKLVAELNLNPFDISRRHTVKVEFMSGVTITTEINGTPDQVVTYYIGKRFNLGAVVDDMQTAIKIWFWDGEQFMQHHRTHIVLEHSFARGHLIDHGHKLGLELKSVTHNGSKWFTDARRTQILELHAAKKITLASLIAKEF